MGLVLCLLLIPLAKADSYQPSSVYLLGLDLYGPIQLFSRLDIGAGGFFESAFGTALPLEGGIVGYTNGAMPGLTFENSLNLYLGALSGGARRKSSAGR